MGAADADQLLHDARRRAAALLEDLLRQQAELDASPPPISEADLAAGRQALAKAVAAARQLLDNLDAAEAANDSSST